MGMFGNMFGKKADYPTLGSETSAAQRLEGVRGALENLARDVPEPLEVVPADQAAYVFIGKPPKKFGMAWIEEGKVNNFQTLIKEKGVKPMAVQALSEKLRAIYERHQAEQRYSIRMADRVIVVTPSEELEHEVQNVIQMVTKH